MQRIRREELPACALFLLFYALGVSCGLACFAEAEGQVLPSSLGVIAEDLWLTSLPKLLIYCLCAAAAHASLVLLAGLSAWFLPVWVCAVLLRSIAVGVCMTVCLDLLRAELPFSRIFAAAMAAALALPFGVELRIGILPLVRRIEPDTTDAEYLSAALRLVLRYLLISLVLSAAVLLFLCYVYALD